MRGIDLASAVPEVADKSSLHSPVSEVEDKSSPVVSEADEKGETVVEIVSSKRHSTGESQDPPQKESNPQAQSGSRDAPTGKSVADKQPASDAAGGKVTFPSLKVADSNAKVAAPDSRVASSPKVAASWNASPPKVAWNASSPRPASPKTPRFKAKLLAAKDKLVSQSIAKVD